MPDNLTGRRKGPRIGPRGPRSYDWTSCLAQIRAAGSEAQGEVGVADPVKAIDSAMAREHFDEIIISTLPEGVSRWLRMDVPNRVKRKFEIPVTTVTAK